ncbi:GNAT family N-acetyltransferase [Hazenella coriacea]|uniref:Putative GNAT family N-acyltransferase n=1 Tax=Hazenella coriacea TaxID=1179467 RepID=A0A4R3LAZ4_9BACL|nr:GNAT family N-acetyltransferase [Hazenella coriacea]TCS94686.1 putative GNAT family N-acyltransferase [Hazenella coriacea]
MTELWLKTVSSPKDLEHAFMVRREVFMLEQKISEEEELDEFDQTAIHLLAFKDDVPIGTCRMRWINSSIIKAERVAVRKEFRQTGAGRKLMLHLEKVAQQQGAQAIMLNAQVQVVPFYQKLGYQPTGAPFYEAGIEHVPMTKVLN